MKSSLYKLHIFALLLVFWHHSFAGSPRLIADSAAFTDDLRNAHTNGIVTGANNLLFKSLGGIENVEYLPVKRAMIAIDQSLEAVCLLNRHQTAAREVNYLLTKPIFALLNQKLYQPADKPALSAELLNEFGQLTSLAKVFEEKPNDRLLVLPLRSYGDVIDKMIAEVPKKNLVKTTNINMQSSSSKMLFSKRAEYSIIYPGEVFEYKQEHPDLEYRSYTLAGTDEAIFGRIMCNKHPDSQAFIEKVNRQLPAIVNSQAMMDLHYQFNTAKDSEAVTRSLATLQSLVVN